MRHALWFTASALLVVACSSGPQLDDAGPLSPSTTSPTSTITSSQPDSTLPADRAPAVLVRAGDAELTLDPWTACWGAVCYDGMPPEDPPDIGSPEEIVVEFPVPEWEFMATVQPVDEECGRRQTEPLESLGDGRHRLVPIGHAGNYDVTLFGQGSGGDVFVSFRWSTPADGALPVPRATASILADHDGRVDSYGVELPIANLAATPSDVVGEVTVTSSEGAAHTFPLSRQDIECTEGSIYLTASTEEGLAAADLGTAPFTYEVRLQLDGQSYVGTGVWPDDVDPECDPCVPLTFTPPLPALETPAA